MRHKVFHNPQGAKVHPIRDFLGSEMPSGRDGFVIEDLDWAITAPEDAQLLIIRKFGERYELDETGHFLIAEFKFRRDLGTHLDDAQRRTFGLMDEQNRFGDAWRTHIGGPKRYGGFYIVAYDETPPSPDSTKWRVRRISGERSETLSWADFSRWLQVVNL